MTSCSQCLVLIRSDCVKKGECLPSHDQPQHTKIASLPSICNASMDNRDIVAIMPTGRFTLLQLSPLTQCA